MIRTLLEKTRSYRRFDESIKVPTDLLEYAIENTRYTSSAMNKQPLRFVIVQQKQIRDQIFSNLKWAASLKDWDGPAEGEKPTAYIIILGNRTKSSMLTWDAGISLQAITLSLMEKGFGSCAILSFNKKEVTRILNITGEFDVELIVAVGKPAEMVVIDDIKESDTVYWRDDEDVHHVPKRTLEELILDRII